ncbi:MAG: hypothetical protein KKH94_05355 [Candidatus Omnitrophica bacterium]|nr:hypothetical protein [Candidatus Omnitrophota bacterium]
MFIPLQKIVKNSIGILLLPVTIICAVSVVSLLTKIRWYTYPQYLLVAGFFCYIIIFALNKSKSFSYIIGHELLHAASSILFGGKLLSIFVSHSKGSVSTTKGNFIISLIPYCIPFYALLLAIGYFFLSIFVNTRPLLPACIFLLGFTLSQHLVLTIIYANTGQSDITSQGVIFSYTIIILSNSIIITLLLNLFLTKISMALFWQQSIQATKQLFFMAVGY